MDDYTPLFSEVDEAQIRQFHEAAYQAAKADGTTDRTYDYLGLTLVVPPDVQPIMSVSHLLGEAVLAETRTSDRVLDMGTGCGVNALLAARASSSVVAVDLSPVAVAAAQANAVRNGVGDRVEVRISDVFSAVDGRFDLIIFDPPFRWFPARDLLEAALTDENYTTLTTFFRSARDHLAANGRILIFFADSGDLGYLRRLIAEEGFGCETVARQRLVRFDRPVDYVTYRLST
jgi:release factor glutamine methyltransferase